MVKSLLLNIVYKDYTEINRKFLFLPVEIWMRLVKIVQIDLKFPRKR